jgi:hypothetical protein
MWKRLVWFLAAIPLTVPGSTSAQVPAAHDALFTADEVAIYRDFLLHYPEQPSEMIGMQDYTMRFVEAYAFGDEPNPPKTFSQEGTRHEQAYLAEFAGRTVLIYIMDMQDPEHAVKAFKESSLPIDLEHRRIMQKVLDERVKLELLYECMRE